LEDYEFLKFEYVNRSLFYTIQGSNSTLKPYLLAAHFDVVGVENNWDHDPFEANIVDSFVYARGALDDKSSMLAQLEAVKIFLKKYGQPRRTFYLAYGHDEEKNGFEGAFNMAQKIKNIELEYVLDEGLMIVENILENFPKPSALISIAEKGYLTIKFTVDTLGRLRNIFLKNKLFKKKISNDNMAGQVF
jgi:carboxypeptidase PM20D1